jgi:hypothetical protein
MFKNPKRHLQKCRRSLTLETQHLGNSDQELQGKKVKTGSKTHSDSKVIGAPFSQVYMVNAQAPLAAFIFRS